MFPKIISEKETGPPVGMITGAGVAPPEAEGSGGRLGAIPLSGKTAWYVGLGVEGLRVVGVKVGEGVVGAEVVGKPVGEDVDGDSLGNGEGPTLGLAVGAFVGAVVGVLVGAFVGALVGALDGLLDGD